MLSAAGGGLPSLDKFVPRPSPTREPLRSILILKLEQVRTRTRRVCDHNSTPYGRLAENEARVIREAMWLDCCSRVSQSSALVHAICETLRVRTTVQ